MGVLAVCQKLVLKIQLLSINKQGKAIIALVGLICDMFQQKCEPGCEGSTLNKFNALYILFGAGFILLQIL